MRARPPKKSLNAGPPAPPTVPTRRSIPGPASQIGSAPARPPLLAPIAARPGPASEIRSAAARVLAPAGGIPSVASHAGTSSGIDVVPAGTVQVPSRTAPASAGRGRSRPQEEHWDDRAVHIAVVGRFRPWSWGRVPDEVHLADALAQAGAEVRRVDDLGPAPALREAGWVIFTARPSSWRRMADLSRGRRTVLWTLDLLDGVPERAPALEAAKSADLVASASTMGPGGAGSHLCLPGACDPFEPALDPRPSRKCAFIGTLYSARRREIARIVRALGGAVVEGPGSWMDPARLAAFVQGTKVVVGDNMRNDLDGYSSARNYVVPGAGGFLLAPSSPRMAGLDPGRHLAVYSDLGGLAGAIESWSCYDDERERVRRDGFAHVRATQTWTARARALLSAMKEAPRRRR